MNSHPILRRAALLLLPAWIAAAPAHAARPTAPPDSAAVAAMLDGVSNASCPMPGIATGGQIAAQHVANLKRGGFRSVLDLRAPDEARGFPEATAVRKAGLAYLTLPFTAATLDDATFDRARALLDDAKHQPMLVHCHSGNRVGVVMLPWLVLDRGWDLERATAAAERSGMRAGPMRERALDYIERHREAR